MSTEPVRISRGSLRAVPRPKNSRGAADIAYQELRDKERRDFFDRILKVLMRLHDHGPVLSYRVESSNI